MTTTEAAARLGLTKRAVSGLCNKATISARKVGRDWWIDETEVDRYARERRPAHRPKKEQTNERA